jgi:Uma2 family endonuclease
MGAHPATASPLVRRYTLEEFFALEPPPDRSRYELIAGVLYAALGVGELWLVDLERRALEQRVLAGAEWRVAGVHDGAARLESAVVAGLAVIAEQVFA